MDQVSNTIFRSPDLHFSSFAGETANFVRMDRDSYHRSIFLDRRAVTLGPKVFEYPLGPLLRCATSIATPSAGWIFHVAHCGSTLLARLIDRKEGGLILREPPPLRQLGVEAASERASLDWDDRLAFAHLLAARRFESNQRTVIKANVPVNFILSQLLKRETEAPTILLYHKLQPYLLAVLRSAEHKGWVDRLTRLVAPALARTVALANGATTAERAAALWLAQMLAFSDAVAFNTKAMTLDADILFAQPVDVARAASQLFWQIDTDVGPDQLALLNRYSKEPSQRFDDSMRRDREARDMVLLQRDIDEARRWVDRCPARDRLPEMFDRPLYGVPGWLL